MSFLDLLEAFDNPKIARISTVPTSHGPANTLKQGTAVFVPKKEKKDDSLLEPHQKSLVVAVEPLVEDSIHVSSTFEKGLPSSKETSGLKTAAADNNASNFTMLNGSTVTLDSAMLNGSTVTVDSGATAEKLEKGRHLGNHHICGICGKRSVLHKFRHVIRVHLKKKLYSCPYCPVENLLFPKTIRDHVRRAHPSNKVEVVDRKPEYQNEIASLISQCFPFFKGRSCLEFKGRNLIKRATSQQHKNTARLPMQIKEDRRLMLVAETVEQVLKMALSENTESKNEHPAVPNESLCCHICRKVVRRNNQDASSHIMSHFGKPIYKCAHCRATAKYPHGIGLHLSRFHPDKPKTWEDHSKKYESDLKQLLHKCFPVLQDSWTTGSTAATVLTESYNIGDLGETGADDDVGSTGSEDIPAEGQVPKGIVELEEAVCDSKSIGQFCKLCKTSFSDLFQHLETSHLKGNEDLNLLGCQQCTFRTMNFASAARHWLQKHTNQGTIDIGASFMLKKEAMNKFEECFLQY